MYNAVESDLFSVFQAQLASISNLISQQSQHDSPSQIQERYYQEQEYSTTFEETVIAPLEDANKKNEAQDHRISNLESKIVDFTTNQDNVNATLKTLESQIGLLALAIKDQSLRPLSSDNEDKDISEWDKVPLSFEEEFQNLTLVEENKNEFEIEEELSKHQEEVAKVVSERIVYLTPPPPPPPPHPN